MRKNMILMLPNIFLLLLLSVSCTKEGAEVDPQIPVREIKYDLVFEDEFEGTLPNPENWGFEQGFVRNEELQWYQEQNAFCEDGKLIIEGRKEQVQNQDYNPNSDNWRENRAYAAYTSSSLNTKGKHDWLYGRIEVKAKIPIQPGMWPAIWTLGIEGEWPSKGEVDIMEYYNEKILANFAWGTTQRWVPKWDGSKKELSLLGPGWADDFHVWRLDWTENKMEIFLDDVLLNSVYLSQTINPVGDIGNPFKQPHYLLLNLAIGSNGGDPSKTTFPIRYEIDYVRVYKVNQE